MQRLLLLALVFGVFGVLGLPACGENTPSSGNNDALSDTAAADVGAQTDSATAGDATVDPGGSKDITVEPVFVLGTNITGKSTPDTFSPIAADSELNVELGPQGLWMVVLAFKTRGTLEPPLLLSGRVVIGGKSLGELKLGKQKLVLGGDGFDYYYNFFLVVAPEGVANKKAIIEFVAEDAGGKKVDLKHPVVLIGGK